MQLRKYSKCKYDPGGYAFPFFKGDGLRGRYNYNPIILLAAGGYGTSDYTDLSAEVFFAMCGWGLRVCGKAVGTRTSDSDVFVWA